MTKLIVSDCSRLPMAPLAARSPVDFGTSRWLLHREATQVLIGLEGASMTRPGMMDTNRSQKLT
jgi:hypothetical protein